MGAALAYADCQVSGAHAHVPRLPTLRIVPSNSGLSAGAADLNGRDLPVLQDGSATAIAFTFPAGDLLHVNSVRPWLGALMAARWGDDGLSGELAAHEVIANAAVHASVGTVRVSLVVGDGELVVDVWDESPKLPRPRMAGDDDESGRGLQMIATLGGELAVWRIGGGKLVRLSLVRKQSESAGPMEADLLALWGDNV